MAHCIVCKKEDPTLETLIPINVRQDGKVIIRRYVHAHCYAGNEEWIKKQVHGKNPKIFVFGGVK